MEDVAKEDPVQQKEPKFLGKAGWLKKASGRLLASYKERYIHVEKTEMVVYEHEDLKNCIERLDLENYDKCLELKSPFKKKHRLTLIRSPKSLNKVHDVKFQAQSAEEKEAWIKAFVDGINRAKNKAFDEVKVDESLNLDHVTRTRPKGNRNRRPPTRIHMKEVADVSSDGILRLDLDLENAIMPNGTHETTVDGTSTTAPTPRSNTGETTETLPEENALSEPEEKKTIIKPPMPPTKEANVSSAPQEESDKEDAPEKKVLKPPMPPQKEAKPCASPVEEASEDSQREQVPEKSPDARKKPGPPPTPPNKPSSQSSIVNLSEASQSRPNSHPPIPPSKEKKPSHSAAEPEQEQEEGAETDNAIAGEELHVSDHKPESADAKDEVSEEESGEIIGSNMERESEKEPQIPTEPLNKGPSPLPTERKKPERPKIDDDAVATLPDPPSDLLGSDTSTSSHLAEERESEVPSIIVSLNDSLTDTLSLSPLLCHSSVEKKKEEEKSVDSGQHSDDESDGSVCEDTLAASTAALRGSHVGLDVLDTSEDDIQIAVILRPNKPPVKPMVPQYRHSELTTPLRASAKAKSASSGDLLLASAVCFPVRQPSRAGTRSTGAHCNEVTKLENEVALEMEKTSDLLSTVAQMGADGEDAPKDLLAEAMEKLKKADHVLREVNKLKIKQKAHDRKSW